jgi:hypothetical protein
MLSHLYIILSQSILIVLSFNSATSVVVKAPANHASSNHFFASLSVFVSATFIFSCWTFSIFATSSALVFLASFSVAIDFALLYHSTLVVLSKIKVFKAAIVHFQNFQSHAF